MKNTITRLRPFAYAEDMARAIPLQKRLEQEMDKNMLSHYQTLEWARFLSWLLGADHVELWAEQDAQGQLISATWLYLYPIKFGKYWLYTPRGPLGDGERLLAKITAAHAKNAVWLRWDPLFEGNEAKDFMAGAKAAHASFQPKSTLVLDLTVGSDAVLAQMKSKGRYNIRLAGKKGVEVWAWTVNEDGQLELLDMKRPVSDTIPSSEDTTTPPTPTLDDLVETYTKLSRETNARDAFSGHGATYFKEFLLKMPKSAYLLLARVEDEWVAGGIFLQQGKTATYYYGASSSRHREKMAPYLVQWTAITYAIENACTTYDFLGVATPGSKDPSDTALAGVTDFKLKFGGQIQTRGQAWEKSLSPLWFSLIRLAKSIRRIISRIKRG